MSWMIENDVQREQIKKGQFITAILGNVALAA
jgi:hypothetical protein